MQIRLTREYVHIEKPPTPAIPDPSQLVAYADDGDGDYRNAPIVEDDEAVAALAAGAATVAVAAGAPAEPPKPAIFFPVGTLGTIKGFTPRTHNGESSRVDVEMTGIIKTDEGIDTITATIPVRVAHVELVANGNGAARLRRTRND